MKNYILPAVIPFMLLFTISCTDEDPLTEAEVIEGLKEALRVSSDTAVLQANQTDGYFKNQAIKVLLPDEADPVINTVSGLPGGQDLLDGVILKLNRAAEEAADEAGPIFLDAIVNITIEDGFNILSGADTAATHYLRVNTTDSLYTAFKPDIQTALESVGAQQAWEEVMTLYNSIPLVEDVNVDLADHTTNRGLHGLFYLISQEEKEIRNNPVDRVTEILEKVFAEE